MVHHPYNPINGMRGKWGPWEARSAGRPLCGQSRSVPIDSRGAVSVEMVFFLLVFTITLFGAVEMAREISVKHALDVGTYRAARYLSLVPNDLATARNMVQAELDANVLGGAGSVQLSVDMPSQSFQASFSLAAEVSYQPSVPMMVFAPKSLRVTHSQSIEAYP